MAEKIASAYDPAQVYAKFRKKKCGCGKESHESCGCSGGSDDSCTCCPVGTVAVYNEKNQHVACLTPNDAELAINAARQCDPGYIKLYDATGEFLGCVTVADQIAYHQANP